MKISQKGLELIKRFEGCRLKAYQDSVGVWTIGYGTTNADKAITGTNIVSGLQISQGTADEWLRQSVDKKYGPKVEKYNAAYGWNQNEFDALVSFAYNIGSIDQLTANGTRSRSMIAEKVLQYNKAGGKVFSGLTRRRKAERALFLTPMVSEKRTGWKNENGKWSFYLSNGQKVKNDWYCDNGKWYWFGADGTMFVNQWVQYKGKWYYLSDSGTMVTDKLFAIKNEIFAFGSDGVMREGTFTVHTNSRGVIEL